MNTEYLISILDEIVIYGFIIILLVVFVLSVIEVIRSYNRVKIKANSREEALPDNLKNAPLEEEIRGRIRTALGNYQKATDRDGHMSVSNDFAFTITPIIRKKTSQKIMSAAPEKLTGIQKLLSRIILLLEVFLKPPVIVCIIKQEKENYKIRVEFQTKGLSSEIITYGEFIHPKDDTTELIDKIVTKILYNLTGEKDTGIFAEESFHDFRKAFREWPDGIFSDVEKKKFEKVKQHLLNALKTDPNSPLINYHLGIIDYYYYNYYGEEVIPLHYFQKAEQSSGNISRLNYLSLVGICRCYCQDYHRHGVNSEKVQKKAIGAAESALDKINKEAHQFPQDLSRAYYCIAFANHIDESKSGIEKGIENYQKAINVYYGNFSINIDSNKKLSFQHIDSLKANPSLTVVYNNLGYILMAYHGRFNYVQEAKEYLYLACEIEKKAVSSDHNYYFAYANLGNIQRLRGEFDDAIFRYENTIELNEKYISGYAELAWVYKQTGEKEKAQKYLNQALELAPNKNRQTKIKKEFDLIEEIVVA